ncbi:MAG: GNAT family N-acetyltransferase [Acidobacteria bacterium]|nr:MAG: GNAT family N-acetyltransferase [Acidobacteriota bacterium]
MTFTIRQAEKEDASSILELIKGLAIYEKAPNEVISTEEDIIRDGFGEQPFFHVFIAENEEKQPIGFALFFYTWSTWTGRPTLYLEDLFVNPAFRGQGIGLALFKRVAKTAVNEKCQRVEWAVLDWNMLARDFYHELGASHSQGWLPYRLTGDALKAFAN